MALADLQRIMRLVPGHDKFRTLFAQIRQEIQGEPARNDENTLPAQPTLG